MGSRTVPVYSISQDSQWSAPSIRDSGAPSASIYSEDFDNPYRNSDVPNIQPLRIQKPSSSSPSDHAHPQQQIHDYGQKVRNSRLPLFSQVRTMLHKPPTANGRAVNVRWDEYSGEISADGKAPHVKPSTYKNPYEGTFEVRQRSTSGLARLASTSSLSPVSTLREDELRAIAPTVTRHDDILPESPVSSASISPIDHELTIRVPITRPPRPQVVETPPPTTKVIKRKPVSSGKATTPPNMPSPNSSPLQGRGPAKSPLNFGSPNARSRFSWTTYDPSVAPTRPSVDDFSGNTYGHPHGDTNLRSRFSWSTWNTGNTPQLRTDSPPPSPPPPLPRKYANPPVQSILSRARPIQRADREGKTPPPPTQPIVVKKATAINAVQTPPPQAKLKRNAENSAKPDTPRDSGGKKLPLPPELQSPSANMSHLELLLRKQEDYELQRRNTERLIFENEKSEKASPMHLSFADYKNAQRRLAQHKARLAEIELEQRQIGIAISRARRKEGEEEGLWVRRVTS